MPKKQSKAPIADEIDPYKAGEFLAKYMPADPEIWFNASSANDYWSFCKDGWLGHQIDGVRPDVLDFFNGWLNATPGGRRALGRYLDKRGVHRFPWPYVQRGEEDWRPTGNEPEVS